MDIPRKTRAVLMAGQSPPRRPETLLEDIAKDYEEEGEWPLWNRYKLLIELERLDHSTFRPIDGAIQAAQHSGLIDDFVVVGKPEMLDYLREAHPRVTFILQGDSFAENMQRGYRALDIIHPMDPREMVLFLLADVPLVTGLILDALVEKAQSALGTQYTQHELLPCVDKQTVGRFARNFASFNDNLFHTKPIIREIKESNFLFANAGTRWEMYDAAYDHRKFLKPSNWAAIARILLFEGQILPVIRLGWQLKVHPKYANLALANRIGAHVFGEVDEQGRAPRMLLENEWPELNWDLDSEEDIARLGWTQAGLYLEHKSLVSPKPGLESRFQDWWGENGRLVAYLRPKDAAGKPDIMNRAHWVMSVEDTMSHMGSDSRYFISRWESAGERAAKYSHDSILQGLMHEAVKYAEIQELGWYGMK